MYEKRKNSPPAALFPLGHLQKIFEGWPEMALEKIKPGPRGSWPRATLPTWQPRGGGGLGGMKPPFLIPRLKTNQATALLHQGLKMQNRSLRATRA